LVLIKTPFLFQILTQMKRIQKLVVLSGAGISAESGLGTFRDSGGLWENYRIEDVATPEAWRRDKALVLEFYNLRRKVNNAAEPNDAHRLMAELEQHFDVHIVTQNIDNLHERAGSTKVLHLHGEITKSKSSGPNQEKAYYDIEGDNIEEGELCPEGYQLRPHVVWFGEAVPLLDTAAEIVSQADIFLVIGTSLNVYPAAGLIHAVSNSCLCFAIDPKDIPVGGRFTHIRQEAGEGMRMFKRLVAGD
jgi:NAD-dependent deacetylase